MPEVRYSNVVVSSVTGISQSSLFEAASRLGIRTNGKGYSIDQIRAIQHNLTNRSRQGNFGTADQLREALNVN